MVSSLDDVSVQDAGYCRGPALMQGSKKIDRIKITRNVDCARVGEAWRSLTGGTPAFNCILALSGFLGSDDSAC